MPTVGIKHTDLEHVKVTDGDRALVAVGDPPSSADTPRKAPRGRWVKLIALAGQMAGESEPKAEKVDGEDVLVGPWVHYPKDREPTVPWQVANRLHKSFGPTSPHRAQHGTYFEILLDKKTRVPSKSTGNSSQSLGVLYIRQVSPVDSEAE